MLMALIIFITLFIWSEHYCFKCNVCAYMPRNRWLVCPSCEAWQWPKGCFLEWRPLANCDYGLCTPR